MRNNIKKLHNHKLSYRAKVILVIEEILNGKSLSELLDPLLESTEMSSRGFVHELLLGTLRQWWALSRISESLIENPVTDQGVQAAINIGLYQLIYMNIPEYAAINDTVEALKQLDKGYGTGLVNAILRKTQKSKAKFTKKVNKNHSLPNWLAKHLKQDWGEYYDELGSALRFAAPIFLRVNTRFSDNASYCQILDEHHIQHSVVSLGYNQAQAIRLDGGVRIGELPYFDEGWVSVQDAHAQLAGFLLAPTLQSQGSHQSVLDMCCAPGGKTTHLLEMFHMKHLTAIDGDRIRLKRVHENISRLKLDTKDISVVHADGTSWRSDQYFDVILLDAPCTATGVLRRHPDIGLLRQEQDITTTVNLQRSILDNLWSQLKVGGVLLYVTCSILKAENERQIIDFLKANNDANAMPFDLSLPHQIKQQVGYQCLPLDTKGGDGFYYALLTKTAK